MPRSGRAPGQHAHPVPVLSYQLTEPFPGFACSPQPMFPGQGLVGLPPLCGRMGYLNCQPTQGLRLSLVI